MKLTDAKLRNLTEPGKHFDGSGLYLDVTKAGGRYWRMKYRHGGKEKKLALGVYPAVGLKDARDQAAEARKVLQAGDDPGAVRKASKARKVAFSSCICRFCAWCSDSAAKRSCACAASACAAFKSAK